MLQLGITRRNYFSRKRESSYGALTDLSHVANLTNEMGTPKPVFYSDTEEAVGYEEETSKRLLAQDAAIPIAGWASDKLMPLLLSFALGADTKSTLGGVACYQHLIAPAGLTTDLYSLTHEQHSIGAADATAGSSFQWTGCTVNRFELTATRKGWVTFSADLIPRGDYNDGSAQTEANLSGPLEYYLFGNTAAWLSTGFLEDAFSVALPTVANTRVTDLDASGLLALSTHLREIHYIIDNYLLGDEGYGANASETGVRTSCPRGRRTQTLTFVLDFNTTTAAVQQYCLNNAGAFIPFGFEWSCVTGTLIATGYYHGWKLLFPKVQLESADRSGANGPQYLNCTATVQADGTNPTVKAYHWNGDNVEYAAAS